MRPWQPSSTDHSDSSTPPACCLLLLMTIRPLSFVVLFASPQPSAFSPAALACPKPKEPLLFPLPSFFPMAMVAQSQHLLSPHCANSCAPKQNNRESCKLCNAAAAHTLHLSRFVTTHTDTGDGGFSKLVHSESTLPYPSKLHSQSTIYSLVPELVHKI